ncbi:MAG: autotransporter domain-containing protein [Desulfobaccales bacterium]
MTMEPSGLIVATGRTQSAGFSMTKGGPTIFNSAPYLQEGVSGDEPFLVKINPSLSGTASLVYSTFLGGGSASGPSGSWSTSVAVDARGAVYVAGQTNANGAPYVPSNLTAPQTFPYTPNAFQKTPQGSEDAMLMEINPSGGSLGYSTYLGGTKSDRTYGLAVDPDGNVVMTGLTFSSNFPLQNPAQTWPGNASYQNAFVTEFSPLYTPNNLIIDNGTTYTVTGNIIYDNEYIGQNSTGTLIQGGFSNTVNNNLELGQNAGASGSYTLSDSGSGSLLSVAGNEYIGYSGTGTFTQSGGANTVTGILILAANAGSSGTYSLSGGSLTVGDYEAVGYFGTGSFTQSGGTHTVTALYLGTNAGASGSYTLSDSGSGSLLAVAGSEFIGEGGSGAFTQTGGTHTVTSLTLGDSSGASGTYNLSGSGSLAVSGNETIGNYGSGAFTQSGGTNTLINQDLELGLYSGSAGTYWLSGGSLSAQNEWIGLSGSGSFSQSGGTNSVGSNLFVGTQGGTGSYNLSGGTLSVAGGEYLGDGGGSGSFTQSGGSHTVSGDFYLGNNAGASGTYNLSGGSLSANDEYLGNGGTAVFIQSGGTNTVVGLLDVGASGSGTYWLQAGSVTAPTFNVLAVGLLTGSGTIQGNVTNWGTVSPGNSPGTLTINGNYTQTASGTLVEQIASANSYSKLVATGSASLAGALTPTLLGGYIPAVNQVFPGVITASGGVSGAFSSVANSTPILGWQVIETAGTVDLLAQRNYAGTGLNLTHNQANVGNMLNGIQGAATGDLGNVLNTIAALPSNSAVANAYQQISPDKAAALSTLAFAGANLQKSTLSRRITDLRFGPGDAGLTAGGLGSFSLNYAQGEGLMVASSASSLTGLLSGQNDPGALEQPWSVYFDPGLILGGQGSTLDQTGFDFTMAGFTAGADYRVWQDLLVGLNTGYTYTSAGFHGSGGWVQGNTWPINAYAAYLPKPFYAYGSLGYALNLYNLERDFNFGGLTRAANSSTTGNQLNAYGETGYDLKLHPVVLTPAVTLSYSQLWLNGFTESNAGALDLTVGPQNAQSLQTGVGGKIALPMQRDYVTVTPQIYGFYQHEYCDGSRTLDARLSQAGNGFNFVADAAHRNFAVLGADVTIASRKNLKVQLDYNAEVGRGNYMAHYISAALRWQF